MNAQVKHMGGGWPHDAQVRQLDIRLEEPGFHEQTCGILLEGGWHVGALGLARADVSHKKLELGDGVHHAHDAPAERRQVKGARRVLPKVPLVEVGHAGGDVDLGGLSGAGNGWRARGA